jgi:hypothetical protein
MKIKSWMSVVLSAVLIPVLSSCQALKPGFGGTWNTNIARLTLTQDKQLVTGSLEGYGGNWNQKITGSVSGNLLTFGEENPLGLSAIVLDGGGDSFRSADPNISFCGTRGNILPNGCGFSGMWNLKAPNLFPSGSYATLTQNTDRVSGSIFDANGNALMQVDGKLTWGKGWQASWQGYTASMTSDEKAFAIRLDSSAPSEWCALRDGVTTAYVFYFTCTVP